MSRSNGGDAIIRIHQDRQRFLGLLEELPGRFRAELYAFVLMDNHYHQIHRSRSAEVLAMLRNFTLT
ncbi:MAG: hypothetical protein FJ404_05660 [Verrucomicrobia bacterium]|nr:hypothetical protein [Verrucomicrobiota bacterium]